jgi:hypothetical protein
MCPLICTTLVVPFPGSHQRLYQKQPEVPTQKPHTAGCGVILALRRLRED